jgi:pyrroline-5-carboxylate reductase
MFRLARYSHGLAVSGGLRPATIRPTLAFSTVKIESQHDNDDAKKLYPNGVFNKIACIGAGMMAQAFIEPMIAGSVQPPEKFAVFDVNVATMQQITKSYHGITASGSIHECVKDADLVICAVKPQNLTETFFTEMRKGANPDGIVLSVIAGKSMHAYYEGGYSKIVRSMPNTPATIGQGMTVWSATENLTVDEREKIRIVLNCCGKSVRTTIAIHSIFRETLHGL